MIGAVIGDIIGSIYEGNPIKSEDFPLFDDKCRFTDDTVLTVALADSILTGESYVLKLREYYRLYPSAGYGSGFRKWASSDSDGPYYSYGNGAAMRISPVGFAFNDIETVLCMAEKYASVTHNHPDGITGAQAAASSIFLARSGYGKNEICEFIESSFGYDLSRRLDDIRPGYRFDSSCPGSVPESIIAFLESSGYEDAVRKAVSMGGDSDTMACIAGGIAQAFYKSVPEKIRSRALGFLDDRLYSIILEFEEKYM